MTPHQLGLELRQLVLRDRLEGRGLDPRRLQAAIGDLCGGEHSELVAPLRYLVLSAAFASAAGQDPPLSDPRQLGRLQQELAQLFAAPLCQRLQPLLEGLLGMAASAPAAPLAGGAVPPFPAGAVPPLTPGAVALSSAAAVPPPVTMVPPAAAPVAAATAAAALAPRSGPSTLNVVLAFVSGMLLMALAGIGLWMQQQRPPRTASGPLPQAGATGVAAPAPPASPLTTPEPPGPVASSEPQNQAVASSAEASGSEATALDRSLASVNALYEALSAKDYARARSLFGPGAADQFDPAFFDQFARVTVQDLRLISQSGSSVQLEGVVSFVYPDGSLQTETRTFTLDSSSEPPLITASEFGRVIKPR